MTGTIVACKAPMNNAEKLRRGQRAKIHCRRLHRVEYVPPTQERLTCTSCGYSEVQEVGGVDFKMDPALAQKLAHYRGKRSDGSDAGIMAECHRCTEMARDQRYPKGWGPLGPQSSTNQSATGKEKA